MSIFNPNINKKKRKIKLGKLTESGYEYSTKVDFKRDFSSQISDFIKERQAYDALNLEIEKLKKVVKKFFSLKKEKNLFYYCAIGSHLSFIKKEIFKEISPYSIFRRIKEEIPEILPHLDDKTAQKHLEVMYKLGQINKKILEKASWDQWYEIMKFKDIYKKQKLLKQTLNECKSGTSGPSLRNKIKNIIQSTYKK